jgi:hypothetical protein
VFSLSDFLRGTVFAEESRPGPTPSAKSQLLFARIILLYTCIIHVNNRENVYVSIAGDAGASHPLEEEP